MESTASRTGGSTEPEPPRCKQSSQGEDPASSRVLDTEMRGSVMMELIVDKLKLLNYERRFCNSRSPPWPRLHKFYFALPSANRNEQFLYFSTMVAWLFTLLGCQFAPPSEADDPNLTCSKIMMELMALGFAPPSWPPARLKQGHGDAVCTVLDTLCSLVLQYLLSSVNVVVAVETPANPSVLANKWKLDLERIAPHLRVVEVADGNDWRAHLERAKKLHDETSVKLLAGKTELKRFADDVTTSMEKLESHENFVNHQFEGLISEYGAVKGRLIGVQERRDQIGEVMQKLAGEHGKVLEALEQVCVFPNGFQSSFFGATILVVTFFSIIAFLSNPS